MSSADTTGESRGGEEYGRLSRVLEDRIQEVLNEFQADLGGQLVLDWVLAAEVALVDEEGRAFRWVTNAPPWRTLGLSEALRIQVGHEMAIALLEGP